MVLVDVPIFGEVGLIAMRRGAGGQAAPLVVGAVRAPRDGDSTIALAELAPTEAGTIALRGPMVPHYPYPPGIEQSGQPHLGLRRYRLWLSRRPCDRGARDH